MKWIANSKTIGTALLIAAMTAFDGPIQAFIQNHPGISGSVVSFVMIALRFFTSGALSLRKPESFSCSRLDCPHVVFPPSNLPTPPKT